jgi:hypothetical protein
MVSAATDLLNVFEVFLPQLLLYPNPSHPFNCDAGALMMKDQKLYDQKVKGENLITILSTFRFVILVRDFLQTNFKEESQLSEILQIGSHSAVAQRAS